MPPHFGHEPQLGQFPLASRVPGVPSVGQLALSVFFLGVLLTAAVSVALCEWDRASAYALASASAKLIM